MNCITMQETAAARAFFMLESIRRVTGKVILNKALHFLTARKSPIDMIEEKTEVPNAHRVLVCGGRNYNDWTMLAGALDGIHKANPVSVIIHGAAQGADKAAGPIRNQAMIDKGSPDLVVAFPGGAGTADMVSRARAANINVIEIKVVPSLGVPVRA